MRPLFTQMLFVGVLLVGCAGTTREPFAREDASGTLRVRTDTYLAQNRDAFPLYRHHAYSVYDAAGRRVRRVANDADESDGCADVVTLPAGQYRIRLNGGRRSGTSFWVTVVPGRLTDIDTTRRR